MDPEPQRSPVEAAQTGLDATVCLDCKHRGTMKERSCYVNLISGGPSPIWKKYQRGGYPFLHRRDYGIFAGRKVRLGAYGEPVLIPLDTLTRLVVHCDGQTGYTHQWRNPRYAAYKQFIMASVDSMAEYEDAKALGWRTFRCRPLGDNHWTSNEVVCPASNEAGHRTTCAECMLCGGTYNGDRRKDITITAHGRGAAKFVQIGAN